MNEPDEITTREGQITPRRLSVDEISFSAHVDFSQNSEFIELVKARQIVCARSLFVSTISLRHF